MISVNIIPQIRLLCINIHNKMHALQAFRSHEKKGLPHVSTTALSFRLCLLYLLQVFLYSAQCTTIYREHSSLNSFAVRDEQASPVPALLRSLYHEPALTRFIACYAGCSFSNGTRKTNAAFGVACFSFVLIISHLQTCAQSHAFKRSINRSNPFLPSSVHL